MLPLTVRRLRDLTTAQQALLLEAVCVGRVSLRDIRKSRTFAALCRLGLLRIVPPVPGEVLVVDEHVPTARGRALVEWSVGEYRTRGMIGDVSAERGARR